MTIMLQNSRYHAVPIDEDNWKTEYYDYGQANIKNMRKYLNQTKWEDIFEGCEDCEEMWKRFSLEVYTTN